MLETSLIDVARLLFQAGGGAAWVMLYLLTFRMLSIIEKVVENEKDGARESGEEGTDGSAPELQERRD